RSAFAAENDRGSTYTLGISRCPASGPCMRAAMLAGTVAPSWLPAQSCTSTPAAQHFGDLLDRWPGAEPLRAGGEHRAVRREDRGAHLTESVRREVGMLDQTDQAQRSEGVGRAHDR